VRRQFKLPAADEKWLDAAGPEWETVIGTQEQKQVHWVLIHEVVVPEGYTVGTVSVALEIPPAYPDAQIDMAYFLPALARKDGRAINSPAERVIDGRPWQRWSRHRTPANPWRAGEDDVSTHMALVMDWLRRELGR
jgi:hypothetical protein